MRKYNFCVITLIICISFLALKNSSAAEVITTANRDKPHLARDFSIWIPEGFDRTSQNASFIIKDINCQFRLLWFSTKDIYPNQNFEFTVGGLSPDTEYEFEVKIYSPGGLNISEKVVFKTEPAPINEVKRILMVIDEDLKDSELEYYYKQYANDLKIISPDTEVEYYYMADNFEGKRELYNYLKEAYFSRNIYYIFFIGSNATMPTYIYLLDSNGEIAQQYFYKSLAFYTNILNNIYEYDEKENRYIKKTYGNCDKTYPELQTKVVYDRFPEISFGTIVPTKKNLDEKRAQIISYFKKLHSFRTGEFSFDRKILYSDTMDGNEHLADDISNISRWKGNIALNTTHEPSRQYHGTDPQWESAYLDALANQSFEMCWIDVHGSTTYHYFGIDYKDINSLPSLNTCFIVLQSCSTGDFLVENYIAGTYLMKGNVLAVEANMVFTFNSLSEKTGFSQNHCYSEIAKGKRLGDALRQNGFTFATHVLFGDPFLSLDDFGKVDLTPPLTPIVNDEGPVTIKRDQLYASWSSSDLESGIVEYQYQIRQDSTTGPIIRDWTSTGTYNNVTAGGLILQVGKTYYFGVKAKNGSGLWSEIGYSDGIKVDAVPTVGTITPSSGSSPANIAVTFTTTYSDPDGWQDIQFIYFMITSYNGANCFYGYYNQNTNKLYLRNDANTAWLGGFSPGSSNIIENSYAKLDCSKTTVSGSGNTLTISWNVTFKSSFLGTKNMHHCVKDDLNATSGWIRKGTWTIK